MKTSRTLLPLMLRMDWAIYLLVVAVLLCVCGGELAAANGAARPALEWSLPVAKISLGAIYTVVVLLVVPVTAFVIVNRRASRNFRARVEGIDVPEVSEVPIVHAKRVSERASVSEE